MCCGLSFLNFFVLKINSLIYCSSIDLSFFDDLYVVPARWIGRCRKLFCGIVPKFPVVVDLGRQGRRMVLGFLKRFLDIIELQDGMADGCFPVNPAFLDHVV